MWSIIENWRNNKNIDGLTGMIKFKYIYTKVFGSSYAAI